MKVNPEDLAEKCRRAMADHIAGAGEASLKRAYDLGRYALDNGFGLLDMTALLHRTMTEIVAARYPGEKSASTVGLAQEFFVESLSPFEMTHRGSQEVTAALRRLNESLNEKLEDMARRVATALHDEAWQLMAAAYLDLHRAIQDAPEPTRQCLERVQGCLKELEENLRRLSHEIRPRILDDLGVVPALGFLAKSISERAGIPIKVEGPKDRRFPPTIETGIYRAVQEALINMTRHASATHATVHLQNNGGKVTCSVKDDGVGFDLEAVLTRPGRTGLGLLGIQERMATLGGILRVNTAPGKGTELRIDIPLKQQDGNSNSPVC